MSTINRINHGLRKITKKKQNKTSRCHVNAVSGFQREFFLKLITTVLRNNEKISDNTKKTMKQQSLFSVKKKEIKLC